MRELLRTRPLPSAGSLVATVPSMWPGLDRDAADRRVRALAGALAGYGLDASRRVAVVAAPTPEAIVALAAAGWCGAAPLLVDPGLPDGALARVLRETGPAFVLAGGEATLRRVIDLRPDLESIELVLALVESGDGAPLPALSVASLVDGGGPEPDDPAPDPGLEIFGADGGTRAWAAAALARRVGEIAGALALSGADIVLLRLRPTDPGWAPALGASLARQARVILDVPGAGGLESALVAHRPTVVFVEASEVESCRRGWEAAVAASSWLRRRTHAWAVEKGAARETRPWARRVADRLVLDAYRARLGGGIRRILCHGGRNDPATQRFFSALGLTLEEANG